jgi:Uma2 family endonuclease
MVLPAKSAKPMTATEFLQRADDAESVRGELLGGEIIAMAPERADHARVKARVWRALADAIDRANLACEAFVDGLGVAIDDYTVYEPDALVNCGETVAADSLLAPAPVVIVEVISPSSRRLDSNAKLADYFRIPGVAHYLVLDCGGRLVVHYARNGDELAVAFVRQGTITLDPPGISIAFSEIFPSVDKI